MILLPLSVEPQFPSYVDRGCFVPSAVPVNRNPAGGYDFLLRALEPFFLPAA